MLEEEHGVIGETSRVFEKYEKQNFILKWIRGRSGFWEVPQFYFRLGNVMTVSGRRPKNRNRDGERYKEE